MHWCSIVGRHGPLGPMLAAAILLLVPAVASGHCDGLDGPVVTAARKALATGDVNLVLIWVTAENETEVRAAFERTLAVRKLGADAQALADLYFFETLVRLHRAGEGESYTGLKPAGRDLGPAIPLADRAIASGRADSLVALLTGALRQGLVDRFDAAKHVSHFASADVEHGREFVRAYVALLHYVERAYEMASSPAAEHAAGHRGADAH